MPESSLKKNWPKQGVKQALVPASLLTSVLDGSLLAVDVRPLVVHVLHGLASAGIERAVVVLGNGAEQLMHSIRQEHFEAMGLRVEFIHGVQITWGSSLANNIMAARAAFVGDEPILMVRSDYLFDWRLLRRMADTGSAFDRDTAAFALIDAAAETLEWVSGAHCKQFCKDGHCNALVKVLRGEGDRIARIGHRLSAYDALQAGIYVARPLIFDELAKLLSSRKFCSVADAMQALAEVGRLKYVEAGELRCNVAWFGHEIMQTALTAHDSDRKLDSSTPAANRVCCDAALSLLFSTMDGGAKSPVRNSTDAGSVPLYALGEAIGQGGNGIVMDATKGGGPRSRLRVPLDSTSTEELPSLPPRTTPPPQGSGSGANGHDSSSKPRTPRQSKELMGKEKVDTTPSPPSQRGPSSGGDAGAGNANLAVKVVRKGQASMQKVLWEVHVLRQLMATPHQHIVRLLDVIDVVDACYLIMERVDGPDLLRWISEQPGGVLPIQKAQRVFAQMCSALRHAHRAGFVHCDVKPENIKLHPLPSRPNSEHAVLLDWGYARRIGLQSEPITQGTPAYAAPEQLTGYQADGVCARASLSATVDVWSLGATLCEMLSGQPPFSGASFEQLVSNVLALNLNAACRRMISDEPRQLIEGMLQIHPSDRYTVDELCRHDWVKEFLPDVDEVEVMLCGEVDEDGKTGGGGLLSRLAPSASLRRSIMMGVYFVLCAGALWTCAHASGGGHPAFELVDSDD